MIPASISANAHRLGWLLAEKLVFLASTFFVGNWVARSLGPQDFGKFSIALSITGVFMSVATLGLDTVLLRRFSMEPQRSARLLATAVALRTLGALAHIACCMAVALVLFGSDSQGLLATLLVAGSWLVRLFDVVGLKLQAEDRYRRAVGIRLASRVVGDAVRVGLILWAPSVVGFALAMMVEAAIGGLLFFHAERSTLAHRPSPDSTMRVLFREGLPIAVSGVLAGLYARVDQAIVYSVLGAAANGQYAAAVRLSELFNLLVVSIGAVAAPHFARLAHLPSGAFDQHLRTYVRGLTAAGLAAALIVSVAAEPIVRLLYGGAFAPAAAVLRIHAWSIPLVFMSVALEPWFYHYGKLDLYVLKTVITLALAVPITLAAAWAGGIAGVAASLVAVYAISVLGTNALLPPARAAFRFQLSLLLGLRGSGAK
jgi:PST family polysaccharide transporter